MTPVESGDDFVRAFMIRLKRRSKARKLCTVLLDANPGLDPESISDVSWDLALKATDISEASLETRALTVELLHDRMYVHKHQKEQRGTRIKAAVEAAKKRGVVHGRPGALTDAQKKLINKLYVAGNSTRHIVECLQQADLTATYKQVWRETHK